MVCVVLSFQISGYSEPTPPQAPPPLGPGSIQTSAGPDEYGYTLSDEGAPTFEDISGTGPTTLDFGSETNNGTATISTVDFPFYSNSTVNTAYVSVNGFLSFDPILKRKTDINKPFPTDSVPNNLIGAFWYDLSLDGTLSHVYTQNFSSPMRTIIQWDNVKAGTLGYITFQIILYETGNIVIAYEPTSTIFTMVTAGIEDADGVTGLNYAIPDLTSGKRVVITRPVPGIHLKARPQVSSAFFTDGEAWISVDVTNITESGPAEDSYSLAWEIPPFWSDPASLSVDWDLTFFDQNCSSEINTLDNLGWDETRSLCMRVTAGDDQVPGYWARYKVTVTSQADNSRSSIIYLQTAIAAPFAQLYQDDNDGLRFDMNSVKGRTYQDVAVPYNGSYMAMNMIRPGYYIITWLEGSDIHYRLCKQYPAALGLERTIAASPVTAVTPDLSPGVAASRDGFIGIAYLVNLYEGTGGDILLNSNVYYALLDPNGNMVGGYPVNLTGNTGWLDILDGYPDPADPIRQYKTPRIVPVGGNKFAIVWWTNYHPYLGMDMEQIEYWVIDTDFLDPLYGYVAELDPNNRHFFPATTYLEDGRFMIAYVNYTGPNDPWVINYTVINPDATVSVASAILDTDSNTDQVDIVQIDSGKVMFAWKDLSTSQINYAILSNDLVSVEVPPTSLVYEDYPGHPNYRSAGYPSVTRSTNGTGVITWQDQDWQDQLYYAQVGSDGSIVTPPSLYRRVDSTMPESQVSTNAYGNAPLAEDFIFLPLSEKFYGTLKIFLDAIYK